MSLDGIWVFEIAGIYGWERVSTIFMEKGRYLGGGALIYSFGTYSTKGKKVTIEVDVTQHGKKSSVFGEKRKHFSTVMKAKRKGDKIEGIAHLKGAHSTTVSYPFRLLRQTDLPDFSGK